MTLKHHVDLQRRARCRCKCHRKPQNLSLSNRFLGSLFVGYSNIPFLSRGCSGGLCKETCKNRSTEISVTYYFPSSVMGKALKVAFASSLFSGPSFSLTLWNIRASGSPWFRHAQDGNIDGLKVLLESGSARLTDVDEDGQSALNVRIAEIAVLEHI